MIVLKFGGTSVGSSESIQQVISILKSYKKQGKEFTVVLSAVGGMTNKLIEMSTIAAAKDETYTSIFTEFENKHIDIVRAIIPLKEQSEVLAQVKKNMNSLAETLKGVFLVGELSNKSLDFIVSHGERTSNYIVAIAATSQGLAADFVDSREVIKTDSNFGGAKIIHDITTKNIKEHFKNKANVQIVTGFVSSNEEGVTTTLGRGGSDYTASILAAALDAEEVEIWTDVSGVMTADPRKVKSAFTLPAISYNEAMELSHFGAKVIYPPTLQPVFTKKIPIRIKNTFKPEDHGTFISEKSGEVNPMRVKGISSIGDVSLVSVEGSGLIGMTGFSARLFSCLAQNNINLILITQASSEHSICFAVSPGEGVIAKEVIENEFALEIQAGKLQAVQVEKELSIVAIIGENMKETPGISGRMFNALGQNGINIDAIAQGSSELNVSAVIQKTDISKALNVLHEAFFLSDYRSLNIFMVGPGLIGATLLQQIKDQHQYHIEKHKLDIKVVAIANSRKMLFDENGIDLDNWKTALEDCTVSSTFDGFIKTMSDLNLPNSVFVDNTSNKALAEKYQTILDASVSIATPNKVANSGSFQQYKALKTTAFKRGVKFMYETNVGAGLPVINTLQNLMHSGDEVLKIEGVLSGSLSFIFNTYDGSTSFKDVVLQAKDAGFTEPDPRDDLNGMDVARKILILAREAGLPLEPEDIKVNNILPQACVDAPDVDSFFAELEKADDVFKKLADDAKASGAKLCFVATLENGKVNVDLVPVGADHPFQSLSGSDNMISYTTVRYKNNPLVIKGPGAGAEVTAAGVFADIISISNELAS